MNYHTKISKMFEDKFTPNVKCKKCNFSNLKFLEAWSFLSMLPVHNDDKEIQFVLALIGLKKLSEFIYSNV